MVTVVLSAQEEIAGERGDDDDPAPQHLVNAGVEHGQAEKL